MDINRELQEIRRLRGEGRKIVFTNGCFDIIHAGHVNYLHKAKSLGDILVVGINTDESIKKIKGDRRPILPLRLRLEVLKALKPVDFVLPFSEETPLRLIEEVMPHVLVKGGDWELDRIVGKEFVESYGGKVVTIPFEYDISTTKIIQRILKLYG